MGMSKVDTSQVAEGMRVVIREDVNIIPGVRPKLVGFLCASSRRPLLWSRVRGSTRVRTMACCP